MVVRISLAVLLAVLLFMAGRWSVRPPEPVLIETVIRDTTEANMYRRMADVQRQRADSLEAVKQQVKVRYEIIYKYLDTAPMPVVDSIIEANR